MEILEGIVDEIGIKGAVEQVEDFFLFLEERWRKKALEQRQETLFEHEAIRYRWKECKNT